MSSPKMLDVSMIVVVSSMDQNIVKEVQDELKKVAPSLSFSPAREQASLNNCLEFSATGKVSEEEKQAMISRLDNDFDEEEGVYSAYSFNTKMFDPRVYYLQMEF